MAPAHTLQAMADYETRRFSRVEYERILELGFFEPGEALVRIQGPVGVDDESEPEPDVDRVLDVYRESQADSAAAFGWRHMRSATLGRAASIAPLAVPTAGVAVEQLLP